MEKDKRYLPGGALLSYDKKTKTLSITIPRGVITIVSTRRYNAPFN